MFVWILFGLVTGISGHGNAVHSRDLNPSKLEDKTPYDVMKTWQNFPAVMSDHLYESSPFSSVLSGSLATVNTDNNGHNHFVGPSSLSPNQWSALPNGHSKLVDFGHPYHNGGLQRLQSTHHHEGDDPTQRLLSAHHHEGDDPTQILASKSSLLKPLIPHLIRSLFYPLNSPIGFQSQSHAEIADPSVPFLFSSLYPFVAEEEIKQSSPQTKEEIPQQEDYFKDVPSEDNIGAIFTMTVNLQGSPVMDNPQGPENQPGSFIDIFQLMNDMIKKSLNIPHNSDKDGGVIMTMVEKTETPNGSEDMESKSESSEVKAYDSEMTKKKSAHELLKSGSGESGESQSLEEHEHGGSHEMEVKWTPLSAPKKTDELVSLSLGDVYDKQGEGEGLTQFGVEVKPDSAVTGKTLTDISDGPLRTPLATFGLTQPIEGTQRKPEGKLPLLPTLNLSNQNHKSVVNIDSLQLDSYELPPQIKADDLSKVLPELGLTSDTHAAVSIESEGDEIRDLLPGYLEEKFNLPSILSSSLLKPEVLGNGDFSQIFSKVWELLQNMDNPTYLPEPQDKSSYFHSKEQISQLAGDKTDVKKGSEILPYKQRVNMATQNDLSNVGDVSKENKINTAPQLVDKTPIKEPAIHSYDNLKPDYKMMDRTPQSSAATDASDEISIQGPADEASSDISIQNSAAEASSDISIQSSAADAFNEISLRSPAAEAFDDISFQISAE